MRHPFSDEAFHDWLKKQSGSYTYMDRRECAIAQYLKAQGFYVSQVYIETWQDGQGNWHKIPEGWNNVVHCVGRSLFSNAAARMDCYIRNKKYYENHPEFA